MQSKLQKILSESRYVPENKNLEAFLFVKIQKRIKMIHQIRSFSYFMASFTSAVALFTYIKSVHAELFNSSVYSYFNLIISEDLSTLTFISKEIMYALVESLPVMSMTLSFGILFLFMFSLNGMLLSLRKIN